MREVILAALLADTARAWELQTDGTYRRAMPEPGADPVDSQQLLLAHYTAGER